MQYRSTPCCTRGVLRQMVSDHSWQQVMSSGMARGTLAATSSLSPVLVARDRCACPTAVTRFLASRQSFHSNLPHIICPEGEIDRGRDRPTA